MIVQGGRPRPPPLNLIWIPVVLQLRSCMKTNCQRLGRVSTCFAVVLWLLSPARAHNGPPFPIIENQTVGPCVVSLWTHPDVGTGTFFVLVDPLPGSRIPDDLKISIGVQPESGRLPEVI